MTDTIYACASGRGPSAIAVYRISGSDTDAVLERLGVMPLPEHRRATLRRLRHPSDGAVVDEALVLRFAKGASYTGEASAEFHIHGGTAVRRLLEQALEAAGARMAEPGAFSRRAFLSGQLDLAQAEAVAALIEAETDAQHRQALEVLDGAVGTQALLWRAGLIDIAALLETGIDFVEEGIGDAIRDEAKKRAEIIYDDLRTHHANARLSDADTGTPVIALIGKPNAGKSSLLNAILSQDAAIVSDRAGTTRDAVSAELVLGGARFRIVDTAGMREASDEIEQAGIEKAKQISERADLRILVVSADTGKPDEQLLERLEPQDVVFWTKSDQVAPDDAAQSVWPKLYEVSARDHSAGVAFEQVLCSAGIGARAGESSIASSARRSALISNAMEFVELALRHLLSDRTEQAAEDLKSAARSMEKMIGVVDHEDVLDTLFSRFCIGK